MWPSSLEAILGTLGLQIIIIEDHAATSKTLSRRVPVDHSSQRFDNKCNSKTVPKLAAPQDKTLPVSRAPVYPHSLARCTPKKWPQLWGLSRGRRWTFVLGGTSTIKT
jgi:hypothetical protein